MATTAIVCDPPPAKKPQMLYTRWHAVCPVCGFEGTGNRERCTDLEDFDVLGADDNCVFCNQCNTEIEV